MGMDIYGQDPDDKVGEYFRSNIWWWRRLWEFCEAVAPDIIPQDNGGQYNEGWGLGYEASKRLASRLKQEATRDFAEETKQALDREIAMTPRPICAQCNGTGVRTDEVGIKYGMPDKVNEKTGKKGWCNGCDGDGTTDPVISMYPFDPEFVMQFADFLEHCGGFAIH